MQSLLHHIEGIRKDLVQQAGTQLRWYLQRVKCPVASHFIRGHRYKKSTACLMNIKQWEDKTLRSYITCFNKEAHSVDEVDDKILVATFTNGLRNGMFLFSLYKNDPKTMLEVLYRATKYMNVKDALLAHEERPKKKERHEDIRQDKGPKIARTGERRDDRRSNPPKENSLVSPR